MTVNVSLIYISLCKKMLFQTILLIDREGQKVIVVRF